MRRPLEMLIIDDETEYVESLYRDAQRSQILLTHKRILDDAKLFLKSDKAIKISGVILDVVGQKSEDQEVAKSSFITAAINYFDKEHPQLPIAILTGVEERYNELSKLYEGTKKVYSKGRDEEEMLSYLKGEALNLNWVKTINKYKDIFEIVEEFFNTETKEALIYCLSNLKTPDNTQIKDNLVGIRRLQEKIYIALNKKKPDWVPKKFIEDDVKVRDILKHLREGEYVDRKTNDFAYAIYTVCSDYGAHTQNHTQGSTVSKYTVHTIAYALLDLFLWFKEVVND